MADGITTFRCAGLRFSVIWSRTRTPWQTVGECYFDVDGNGDDTVCHPPIAGRAVFGTMLEIPMKEGLCSAGILSAGADDVGPHPVFTIL